MLGKILIRIKIKCLVSQILIFHSKLLRMMKTLASHNKYGSKINCFNNWIKKTILQINSQTNFVLPMAQSIITQKHTNEMFWLELCISMNSYQNSAKHDCHLLNTATSSLQLLTSINCCSCCCAVGLPFVLLSRTIDIFWAGNW